MCGIVVGVKIRPFSYTKDGVTKSGRNIFLNVVEEPSANDVVIGEVSSIVEISEHTSTPGCTNPADLIGCKCLFESVYSQKYHKVFITSVYVLEKGGESK